MEPSKRQVLGEIGLIRNETEVYLALTSLGSASAGMIAKECCLHRRNIYDALEKLVQRGLVGYVTRGKTRHFEAAGPQRLLDVLRERKASLETGEKRLRELMPELLGSRNNKESQDVSIFMGREGRKLVFNDILSNARENLVLGGVPPSGKAENYMRQYNRKRAAAGIRNRMIYNRKHEFIGFLKTLENTEVRIMPRELDSNVSFNIYDGKVAILLRIGENPVTILIDNRNVANDFREYFNFMWDISRKA